MGIQNFPASLQPIIQQGFLEREFEQALRSQLAYREVADRDDIAVGIGETITKTRAGLMPTVTTPLSPATNTNLDNGLTTGNWSVEQYTLSMNFYAATIDLNMVTSRVGIANQFLQNAYANGEQAKRSLDELARNALFASYFNGNTRVRTTLGSAGPAIAVDDIRGFTQAPSVAGFTSAAAAIAAGVQPTWAAISGSNSISVVVGSDTYTLIGATPDATNVSTTPNGRRGAPSRHRRSLRSRSWICSRSPVTMPMCRAGSLRLSGGAGAQDGRRGAGFSGDAGCCARTGRTAGHFGTVGGFPCGAPGQAGPSRG